MLVYELYRLWIKEGYGELYEHLMFTVFLFPCFLVDLIASPLEILAFILWKIDGRK